VLELQRPAAHVDRPFLRRTGSWWTRTSILAMDGVEFVHFAATDDECLYRAGAQVDRLFSAAAGLRADPASRPARDSALPAYPTANYSASRERPELLPPGRP